MERLSLFKVYVYLPRPGLDQKNGREANMEIGINTSSFINNHH